MGDLGQIFLLSLVAMFNPTLLAAVTLMLLLPNPKRLMLGYLLGAYTASMSTGLVIVFALPESGVTSTSKNTLSPAEDVVVGLLLLIVALVLATDRDRPLRERRERRKDRSRRSARVRKGNRCRCGCWAAARPASPSSLACCSASRASPT
ncbi:MAG TPA: GAP family protein [Solirubrobacterales bacterium]|nr:GAP family protein [Solirubrobacterales bacterium]